eukprot:6135533-Prymnesium_polylepis.1
MIPHACAFGAAPRDSSATDASVILNFHGAFKDPKKHKAYKTPKKVSRQVLPHHPLRGRGGLHHQWLRREEQGRGAPPLAAPHHRAAPHHTAPNAVELTHRTVRGPACIFS